MNQVSFLHTLHFNYIDNTFEKEQKRNGTENKKNKKKINRNKTNVGKTNT